MSFDNPPFTIRRGDDRAITITVDGALDLRAASLRFTYGRNRSEALVTKTETTMGVGLGSTGIISIPLPASETASLQMNRQYYYQAQITLDGVHDTVATGSFFIVPNQRAI